MVGQTPKRFVARRWWWWIPGQRVMRCWRSEPIPRVTIVRRLVEMAFRSLKLLLRQAGWAVQMRKRQYSAEMAARRQHHPRKDSKGCQRRARSLRGWTVVQRHLHRSGEQVSTLEGYVLTWPRSSAPTRLLERRWLSLLAGSGLTCRYRSGWGDSVPHRGRTGWLHRHYRGQLASADPTGPPTLEPLPPEEMSVRIHG